MAVGGVHGAAGGGLGWVRGECGEERVWGGGQDVWIKEKQVTYEGTARFDLLKCSI